MARFIMPVEQLVNSDASGIASGWKLNFYVTGTTTRKDTFSDSALTTANANPVVADSAGRFGDIFLESGTYKVVLTDGDDTEIWTADPVDGAPGASGAVVSKTASYTVTVSDATKTILVDTSAGDATITLLAAATAGDGFEVTVKKTTADDNIVTIDGNGSETIDGAATVTMNTQYQSVTVRTDGSAWYIRNRVKEPPTGFVQFTIDDAAPSGWLLLNGDSIGDTGSGATHAGAIYEELYALFWASMTDTHAAVSTGRGASAQADWDAGKTLTMPDARGRAIIGTGTGAGLTARTHGDDSIGAEDAIVVAHTHTEGSLATASDGAHTHTITGEGAAAGGTGNDIVSLFADDGGTANVTSDIGGADSNGAHTHTISGTTDSTGSSATDANMMPALALNVIVKI